MSAREPGTVPTTWSDLLDELDARNRAIASAIDAGDWAGIVAIGAFTPPATFDPQLDAPTRKRAIDVLAETTRLEGLLAEVVAATTPPAHPPLARRRRRSATNEVSYLDRLA